MASVRRGLKGKLYYNSATYGSPTWVALDIAGDVELTFEFEEADATTRASGGVKLTEPTLCNVEISGKVREDEVDTGYLAMEAVTLTAAAWDVLFLTEATTFVGARGVRGEMKNFKWNNSLAMNGIQMRDFTLKPCVSDNAIKKAVVGSGPTLAYSAIGF